ncbi:sirohydrochlorin chelatase [Streptomyces sp. YIM 98790]|uniref:sirohydrochlorin chelatase n=1 Tax=Streptomyces sp. YIM 98790 TaxID=2689077 RepID=UPI0014090112|nr:CbiX/SirB N-terminal domain-containing protein [Streptomyces sp. YIM 98790]
MTAASTGPTLVAVAHGSPDPRAQHTIRALLRRVRALRPAVRVELGHLETDRPLLADTLRGLHGETVLVPLLFGRGYHVKHDIPGVLAGAGHCSATVAACLGPHPLLVDALHGRLLQAGYRGGAVVLAAAGSRDPESAAGTRYTADMLAARLGGVPVVPAYASAAAPTVPEAVSLLRAGGHREIAVASCFTAPGYFASRCAEAAPGVVSAPLGAHPALARLLLHRYDQAVTARRSALVA